MVSLLHRTIGFAALSGRGLEIGALHEPAPLPEGASVQYFDVVDKSQAQHFSPRFPRSNWSRSLS